VRIFSENTLRDFWRRHPDSQEALREWRRISRQADWATPAQVRDQFPNASILRNNRVVFRIRGNNYRLVTEIAYHRRRVDIRFIGTHSEYDRINAQEV
jgi:mRNA interferase HigB